MDVGGGEREGGADAEAAEGAGVHPVTGAVDAHLPGGVGDDVAPVTDHDRVGVRPACHLGREPQRVHRARVGGGCLVAGRAATRLLGAQLLEPGGRTGSAEAAVVRQQRPEEARDVADDAVGDRAVVPDAVRLGVDVDDGDVVAVGRWAAVADPEVEVDAQRQHDVGLAQRLAA